MRFSSNLWAGLGLWFTLAGLGAQPLKFELLKRDLVVVRGSIGSLEGLRFLVDTGAMPSMVDRKLAKKLALDVHKSMLVAFGVKTGVQKTLLPNLRLGPLHVESVSAGVGDLSFLNGIDAIIGLDVLTRKSFSIDYEARLMTFGPVEAQEPSVLLEATAPFLTVQLGISGKPFRFLVDTGSSHLILFERRVRNRLPRFIVLGELTIHHLSGASRLQRVFLPPVDADGSSIEHIEGYMSDQSVDGYPAGIDGVLGIRALSPKRVDFDFERERLAFN
jgi:Aspartyl protease